MTAASRLVSDVAFSDDAKAGAFEQYPKSASGRAFARSGFDIHPAGARRAIESARRWPAPGRRMVESFPESDGDICEQNDRCECEANCCAVKQRRNRRFIRMCGH